MKKGDLRKQEILRTAERFFYTMGYEKTTIQDIIDALKLSKGGFYHHFESKETLITELCEQKLEAASKGAADAAKREHNPVAMLNTLLDKSSIFKQAHVQFIGLLIRVAYRDDNLFMREKIRRKISETLLPPLCEIIKTGVSQGVFYTPYPDDIGTIILSLVNSLNDEIALILLSLQAETSGMMLILGRLEFYRHVVERLIEAPFASIVIYEMGALADLCTAIADKQRHESWDILEKIHNENPDMPDSF